MKCVGEFVFKSLTEREGGSFNDDTGKEISYGTVYILKVDEISGDEQINERKFKIAKEDISKFRNVFGIKPYTKVMITFDVVFYRTRCGLTVDKVVEYREEYNEEDEE